MSRMGVLAALGALLSFAAPAAAPGTAEAPALRLASTSPLTIRGAGFEPRERVTLRVQVVSTKTRRVRSVVAGRLGGFSVTFPALRGVGRCDLVAAAVGSRGSRASLRATESRCRPRAPALRVVGTMPLAVVGTQFLPGEAVVVRVTGAGDARERRVRAAADGRFTAEFAEVEIVDRCNSDVLVRASGARGSQATAKIGPLPQCPPRN